MSLLGIGSGQAPLAQCVALAHRPGVRQGWLNCQRLVIDEISMVEADFFDKLEAVARSVLEQGQSLRSESGYFPQGVCPPSIYL